jgi:hypothetical protein
LLKQLDRAARPDGPVELVDAKDAGADDDHVRADLIGTDLINTVPGAPGWCCQFQSPMTKD